MLGESRQISKPLISAVVAAMLCGISGCSPSNDQGSQASADASSAAASSEAAASSGNAKRLLDAKYLDDKYSAEAQAGCSVGVDDYLRSIAKYDFAWDDSAKGLFGTKFAKYLSYVTAPGVVTLVSDSAKLQNGFGAFEHIEFYCNFDTQQNKVLNFSMDQPQPMADQSAAPSDTSQASSFAPDEFNAAPPSTDNATGPQPPAPSSQSGALAPAPQQTMPQNPPSAAPSTSPPAAANVGS